MAQPNIELDGLLAFPLTPFTDDLELNLDAFGETVEGHVEAGAGALFIACGTGEFSALSADAARHRTTRRRQRDRAGDRVHDLDLPHVAEARLRQGELIIEKIPPTDTSNPPGALLHHWRGTAFVPRANAAPLEHLLRSIDDYPRYFSPQVLHAKSTSQTPCS